MLTQYEVMHMENLMVRDSWWRDDYDKIEGYLWEDEEDDDEEDEEWL